MGRRSDRDSEVRRFGARARVVVVGSSLSAAVGRSVYLDVNARIQSRVLAMGGKPIYNLPPEKVVHAVNPYDREWEAWRRNALKALK